MKKQTLMRGIGSATILSTIAVGSVVAATPKEAKKMNVVFILADDLGFNDVTLYGGTTLYETPNLERLAKRGMLFDNAYSASPLSSPTRSSILTGCTPARTCVTAASCHLSTERTTQAVAKAAPANEKAIGCVGATRLDNTLPTLGKMMKGAGYSTAHFGKWHLGKEPYSPLEQGFDVDIPHWPGPGPAGSYVAPWKYPNFKGNFEKEHIEDRMSREAISWMQNRDASKPFYMNYWQFSVHGPFDAKQEYIDKYRKVIHKDDRQNSATYAAMVHSMDDAVGALLDEIDRQGIADETIIIFYSDNGGNGYSQIREKDADGNEYYAYPTSNYPLRGGKGCVWEGGIHVPCIVVWPGVVEPGSKSSVRVQSTDFYPTLLNNLDIEMPKDYEVDGQDMEKALKGGHYNRKPMFTYFPHQTPAVPGWTTEAIAVHYGDYKLVRQFFEGDNGEHKYSLFNLKEDISENINLAEEKPKVVKKMDKMIEDYLQKYDVVTPIPNPKFDPAKYQPELIGVPKSKLKTITNK